MCVCVGSGRVARLFCQRGGALEGLVGPCEAGVRTGGRKLEGSKRETDRNGSAYPALLVEYDDDLLACFFSFSRAFDVSFEFR